MAEEGKQLKDSPEYGSLQLKKGTHTIVISQSAVRFLRKFGRKGDSWLAAMDSLVVLAKANKLKLPDPEEDGGD